MLKYLARNVYICFMRKRKKIKKLIDDERFRSNWIAISAAFFIILMIYFILLAL